MDALGSESVHLKRRQRHADNRGRLVWVTPDGLMSFAPDQRGVLMGFTL